MTTSTHPRRTTRPETAGDASGIRSVHLDAFPTSEEADLVDRLRGDAAWINGLSWVVVEDERIVAHALLTRCHIDETPSLALAPVAVVPDRQQRGLGQEVTQATLDAARDTGEGSVVVLGHPDYYPRFGFSTASASGVSVSFPVPDEALMVMSLDGTVVPRGEVRYAAAFGI